MRSDEKERDVARLPSPQRKPREAPPTAIELCKLEQHICGLPMLSDSGADNTRPLGSQSRSFQATFEFLRYGCLPCGLMSLSTPQVEQLQGEPHRETMILAATEAAAM